MQLSSRKLSVPLSCNGVLHSGVDCVVSIRSVITVGIAFTC